MTSTVPSAAGVIQLVGQGLELHRVEFAVNLTGDARVQPDEPKPADADHLIERAMLRLVPEQVRAQKGDIVMVARERRAGRRRIAQRGVDHRAQPATPASP